VHIILHTQYYPPEIGAPQARLSALARGLTRLGHQVTVLTAMPSYPQGKVYPGHGGLVNKETQDGVRIVRTGIIATQKTSLLPRMTNYFSFVITSLVWGLFLLPRVDYLLTESPPLFLGMAGYLLSRMKKARWIFNVSDLWPESAVSVGAVRPGLALRSSYWLEAFCYRKSWLVTGQSKSILADIHQRFPEVRTYHFSNGVDVSVFQPSTCNRELVEGSRIVAMYAGLHGLAQGLDQILSAACELVEDSRLGIILIGDGPEKKALIQRAQELGLSNVKFLAPVPSSQMPEILSTADICLVPLKTYIPGAVPSKLYEAMACGKPVILIAEGEAAQIVKDHRAGIVVTPGDIPGLVAAFRHLIEDFELRRSMGQAGRRAVEKYFDRTEIIQQLAAFLMS
jgi:glycosyltransferase involved in cell wall biosynthesis